MTKCKSKDKIKLDLKYRLFVKKKNIRAYIFLQFIRYSEIAKRISCLIFIVLIITFDYRQFY